MPNSDFSESSSTIHSEEIINLPFGIRSNRFSTKNLPLANIAMIGIILLVVIPAIYFIGTEILDSQAIQNNDLEVTEQVVEYKTSSAIEEVLIIEEILEVIEEDVPVQQFKNSEKFQGWVFSGPFGISKTTYKSDETVEFFASDIVSGDAGQILVKKPNGDVYKVIDYDGSDNKFYKIEFIPKYADEKKCSECVFGTWKISINSNNGNYNAPIYFKVKE